MLTNIKEIIRTDKFLLSFSGGQDSTTCLVMLLAEGVPKENIYLCSFCYGQKHNFAESKAQLAIMDKLDIPKENFIVQDIPILSCSGLLEDSTMDLSKMHWQNKELPASFVPGRNLLFLLYMAQVGYGLGIYNLVIGVNAVDYSGYPDCRPAAIKAIEDAIRYGFDMPKYMIYAPLIFKSKSEIVKAAINTGPNSIEILQLTHTCYKGKEPGCGECPACKIRAEGFLKAGYADPRFL